MSRHLLLVLFLASAVALAVAQDKPKTQPTGAAAKTQKKPAAAQLPNAAAKPKKATQGQADSAKPKKEDAQPQADGPQGKADGGDAMPDEGPKLTSVPDSKALGMSILGNQDAPKSLVIVPWKTSELGDSPDISPLLDDSRQPVDKEVFMRSLRYYEIRSKTK
jgi:hypothetical protein